MNRKVLLMILDGWGEGEHNWTNAIYTQGAPYIDSLRAKYPTGHLQACGEYVGLPDGQMGNSEVGHLNLGAGRVVYQDLVKINMACRDHKLLDNKEIKAAYDYVAKTGKQLHFMGLASMGGVHSSLEHVYEFLAVAKQYNLDKVFVHCFMDGRDTDPKSGKGFVEELQGRISLRTLLCDGPRQEMGKGQARIRPPRKGRRGKVHFRHRWNPGIIRRRRHRRIHQACFSH